MKRILKYICKFILLFVIYYICFHKSRIYIRPNQWSITGINNEICINVSTSLSFIKWTHSYKRMGNDLFVKTYLVPHFNPFNQNTGAFYTFYISESLEEIEHIYTYDRNNQLVLVYTKE